jgi:hypothetical protein
MINGTGKQAIKNRAAEYPILLRKSGPPPGDPGQERDIPAATGGTETER